MGGRGGHIYEVRIVLGHIGVGLLVAVDDEGLEQDFAKEPVIYPLHESHGVWCVPREIAHSL